MIDGDLIITDETQPPFSQDLEPGTTYTFEIAIDWELTDGAGGRIELFFADVSNEAITRSVTGTGQYETEIITAEKTVPDDHGGQDFYISSILYDENDEFVEGDDETWYVTPGDNTPPSIDSRSPSDGAIEVPVDETLTFSVTASDDDGDALNHTWYSKLVEDDGYTQQSTGSGSYSEYSHTFSQAKDYLIKIEVDDGATYDSYTWTIAADDAHSNTPPSISAQNPSEQAFEVDTGEAVTFSVDASDEDGDSLNHTWFSKLAEENSYTQESTGSGGFSEYTHTFSQATEYQIKVEVDDGAAYDSYTWSITANDAATPPVVERISPSQSSLEVTVDEQRQFEVRATDDDNDLSIIEWFLDGQAQQGDDVPSTSPQNSTWSHTFTETGEYTIEAVATDTESQTDSTTWTASVSVEELDVSIGRLGVDDTGTDAYAAGDDVPLLAEIRNDSSVDAEIGVEFSIIDPTGEETVVPRNTRYRETVPADDAVQIRENWTVPRDPVGGTYDLRTWVYDRTQSDDALIANDVVESVFQVDTGPSTADLSIYPIDTQGSPVADTTITIEAANGTVSATGTATGGEVAFSDVPVGRYSVTAESRNVHQRIREDIVVSGSQTEHELAFEPSEEISGVVVKEEGDQVVSDASVEIRRAELAPAIGQGTADLGFNGRTVEPLEIEGLATRPDAAGQFEFDIPLPDGEYEFAVEANGDENVETVDMGLNRSAALKAPVVPPQTSDNEIQFQEDNYLVSIVLQNLELSDILLPARMHVANHHGVVKGGVRALLDIVDDLSDLLEFDIGEFIDGIKRLWQLIVEDWTVIKQLLDMMIEDFLEKQREENPHEQGTLQYEAFRGGWLSGYAAVNLAIGFAASAGTGAVARAVASAPRVKSAIDGVASLVGNSDRVPDAFALAARSTRKGTARLPGGDNSISKEKIAGILQKAPDIDDYNPEFTKKVMIAYRSRLRRPYSQDIDHPFESAGAPKGDMAEQVAIRDLQRLEALPATGLFRIGSSLPDLDKLVPGKRYVVQNLELPPDDSPVDTRTELDTVVVDVADDAGEQITIEDLDIAHAVEVTTSGNKAGWAKTRDKMTGLKKLRDDIEAGKIDPEDRVSGVPYRLFMEDKFDLGHDNPDSISDASDLPDVNDRDLLSYGPADREQTGFDETFDATAREISATEEHLEQKKDKLPLFSKALSGD